MKRLLGTGWLVVLLGSQAFAQIPPIQPQGKSKVAPKSAPSLSTKKPVSPPRPKPKAAVVARFVSILHSPASEQFGGWRAKWEWNGAQAVLQELGVKVRVLEPEELVARGCSTPLLILPNCRNMDSPTVEAIKQHVRKGGKLLATYQTSYRQADNRSWNPNGFALSNELGVRFTRWSGGGSECSKLVAPGGGEVVLLRHQAMLVEPLAGSQVLSYWDRPDKAPAVVEGVGGIYCGEDLFAPENAHSPQVQKLLCSYLSYLDRQLRPKLPAHPPRLPLPEPPFTPLNGLEQQPRIRVGVAGMELPEGRIRVRAHRGVLKTVTGGATQSCRDATLTLDNGKLQLSGSLGEGSRLKRFDFVQGEPGAISIESADSQSYLDVFWESKEGAGRWQAYRGSLELAAVNGQIQMTNVLPVDGYLAGVVPSEVPSTFPGETLKAMAVVARSYCLSHFERHKAEGYDVCSEVHCQVYRGLSQESESTNNAVAATLGEVLLYNGKPADATFHACCGGYGVDVEAIWPKAAAIPYLRGFPDFEGISGYDLANDRELRAWLAQPSSAFCQAAGRIRWEEKIRWSELESKLEQSLPVLLGKDTYRGLGALKDFRVEVRDVSGRVTRLVMEGEKGIYVLGGDATRWLFSGGRVGAGGLNSSLFVVDIEGVGSDKVLKLKGAGWGHGVGLCQEGAAGRARAGQSYRQILSHYYRGAKLVKDPPPVPQIILPRTGN